MLYAPFTFFKETARLLFQKRVKDGQLAFLGDTDGPGARVEVPDAPGYVYARFQNVPDANGNATFSAPFLVRSGNAAFQNYPGASVYVAVGYNGELEIVSANYQELGRNGIDTRTLNPLHQQSKWVYKWQFTIGLSSAVANSINSSYLVTVKKYLRYFDNVFASSETGAQADKIDLASVVPGVDMHRYATVWLDVYTGEYEVTTSTAQSLFTTIDDSDLLETVVNRPPDAVPHKTFYLANNQGTITQQPVRDRDVRQFLNMPQVHGFPNPVTYRERIHPDKQVLFAGSLVVTGSLQVLGSLIGVPTVGSGGGGSANVSGWQDDGTVVRLQTTTDNVNIGGTTDSGKLAVIGDTDEVTARIRAASGQSGSNGILRIENDAGAEMVRFSVGGGVEVNVHQGLGGFLSVLGSNGNTILYADPVGNGLGIGTSLIDTSTLFDVYSTVRGTRPAPSMTTTQRNAIGTPATGLLIYNTTTNQYEFYTGAVWSGLAGANAALSNLASVAINTTLVSDTDNTDDLGSASVKWRATFTNLLVLEERTAPSTPSSNDYAIYGKAAGGSTELFAINDAGIEKQISVSRAKIIDSKTTTTTGGTSGNTTWNARDLNTEESDPDGIVTINSNKFVVIAGTYDADIETPFLGGTAAGSGGRCRLWNVTAGVLVATGSNAFAGVNTGAVALLKCRFTSNGTDEYRVDTYTQTGRNTNGLGASANDGSAEKYTSIILEKVG